MTPEQICVSKEAAVRSGVSVILAKCTRCKLHKKEDEFYNSKYEKLGKDRICKLCSSFINKKQQLLPGRCFYRYKKSALIRGLEFSITKEIFLQYWKLPCEYCHSEIKTIGLDRKNNKVGYTLENIVSCCKSCNYMKRNMLFGDFISHCKKIVAVQGLDDVTHKEN